MAIEIPDTALDQIIDAAPALTATQLTGLVRSALAHRIGQRRELARLAALGDHVDGRERQYFAVCAMYRGDFMSDFKVHEFQGLAAGASVLIAFAATYFPETMLPADVYESQIKTVRNHLSMAPIGAVNYVIKDNGHGDIHAVEMYIARSREAIDAKVAELQRTYRGVGSAGIPNLVRPR